MAMLRIILMLLLPLASLAAGGNYSRCFEGEDLILPVYSTRVTLCPMGDICMMHEFVTSSGRRMFDLGCMSPSRCGMGNHTVPVMTSFGRRSDVTTCIHCCHGDYCNQEGCGYIPPKQPARGPLCFHCDYEDESFYCRTTMQCDKGDVCMLTELDRLSPDGKPLYRSSCEAPPICQSQNELSIMGKKRDIKPCHVCCTDDFCNSKCQNSSTSTDTPTITSAQTTPTPVAVTSSSHVTSSVSSSTPWPTSTSSSIASSNTSSSTSWPLTTPTMPNKSSPSTTPHVPKQCEHMTTHTTIEQCARCSQYPDYHYEPVSGLCYKLHDGEHDWDDCNANCRHEHGRLAVVDTEAKWLALKAAIIHHYGHDHDVYLGAKENEHGHYHWTNGDRMTYDSWDGDQPDGHDEHCLYTSAKYDRDWHDTKCSHDRRYACTIDVQ